ncbi:AI-2E family transporter [Rubellimicrobium sp. CFH 75288]|uniref:AI-2E family transporter n=1 Tax=Rubellimicrobium sp. CFH 75288 TaxID=2697034 RepID=UPI001411EB16|nr:AI-2E family transporter [Rubellimicrobium sp. CFH 75288]NAZ35913.1 AI-2E family transporter [Rubellimicrobium sp. CFH 75288]
MAVSVERQARIWGVAALVFLVLLWLLGDVIMPFLLGGALAYVLDPLADRLVRLGLRRVWAVALITLGALLAIMAVVLLVIPVLVNQATALFRIAPVLIAQATGWLTERFPDLLVETSPIRQQLADLGLALQARGLEFLNTLLSGAMGLLNWVFVIIVVPVVTFYMLLDWDRMVERIDDLLPREHAPTIRMLARESDATLAAFIRGQALVCLILGSYYALALAAVGLSFGLVVGAIAGALTFIPYVGALVGGLLAIGLALFQFWGDWPWIILVAVIFQLGQIVEGNFLTPKLVGDRVGVHPVWLIFALAAFGALFGFVGVLVAVPVSAVIGVLVRFALAKYKTSPLYLGTPPPPP